MTTSTERTLPHGIAKATPAWLALLGVGIVLLAWGVYEYSRQATQGEISTGMRDVGTMGGATWGLYIVFVVYFIGVSFAGIVIAALIRVFDLKTLKPVARIAEVLTVITIALGALAILADLGQPLRGIVNLFRYARPQSPFFGTFTLVTSGYLFASLVYLYLDGRRDAAACAKTRTGLTWFHRLWAAGYKDTPAERERHKKASLWLALGIIPLLITAHSTLGFVFGLQVGRPGWYSALQAPAFVVLAGVSGVGLLIVVAALVRSVFHEQDRIGERIFRTLGIFLLILTLTYLYFMIVDVLTTAYTGTPADRAVMNDEIFGSYAPLFWTAVASLVVPVVIVGALAATKRWNIPWLVAAGALVNVAAVLKRYLLVVPSLANNALLPYEAGSYSPTLVEYGVIAGLVGLGLVVFFVFAKAFPLVPMHEEGDA